MNNEAQGNFDEFVRELCRSKQDWNLIMVDLDDEECAELTALYYETKNRDGATELLMQNKIESKCECINALIKLMKHDTKDNRENLVETIMQNAIDVSSKQVYEALRESCARARIDHDERLKEDAA